MTFPDRTILKQQFDAYLGTLRLIAGDLADAVDRALAELPSYPSVRGRIKDFHSFYKKYLRLLKNQPFLDEKAKANPFACITDLVGLRIICPFLEDLTFVQNTLKEHFPVLEIDKKGAHFSFKEFGYESVHLLIEIPPSILEKHGNSFCTVAEIQIRTILQDAWAEVEHELVYKAAFTPFDGPMKRKLAAVNATLSLADSIFQEIRSYQRQLNEELGKRRSSFYRKIEDATDALLFAEENEGEGLVIPYKLPEVQKNTIDELLLNALYAHNKSQFTEAICFYSRILDLNPDDSIASLIYKHRGMANFAQSSYDDAIEDFSRSLEYDASSYKAAYYRGVVRSVLRDYPKALEDFSLSLSLNPYQNYTLYRRAQAYYHLEDYPAALADCEAALALSPDSEAILRLREMLMDKLKMLG